MSARAFRVRLLLLLPLRAHEAMKLRAPRAQVRAWGDEDSHEREGVWGTQSRRPAMDKRHARGMFTSTERRERGNKRREGGRHQTESFAKINPERRERRMQSLVTTGEEGKTKQKRDGTQREAARKLTRAYMPAMRASDEFVAHTGKGRDAS